MKYNAINLNHGTPGLMPPDFLLQNMEQTLRDHANNQYTMFTGHPLLRERISEFFSPLMKNGNRGNDLNPNTQVLVTNGALGSINSAITNLVGPGDEVLMFEPYFTQYVNCIEFAGASIKTAPMHLKDGCWDFDWDAFEKAITKDTKLVLITNPHNPSGKLFTRDEIAKLSEILDKHPQVRVLSDDVYYFLPFDGREYVSFADYSPSNFEKTITVYSAGKMLNCTGWKIGWSVGPPDLIRHAMYVHESTCFNNNVPG